MRDIRPIALLCALLLPLPAAGSDAAPTKPPEKPAEISIEVAPDAVPAGGEAEVTLRLDPIEGIKIARYPQIKLAVEAQDGLVGEALATIGSKTPPPPDRLETNYWKVVDPVVLKLAIDAGASAGEHRIDAKLTYYYCVAGNFCAPKRVTLQIPVAVR